MVDFRHSNNSNRNYLQNVSFVGFNCLQVDGLTMQFEFSTTARIIFGIGKIHEIGNLAEVMGSKVMVVHGSSLNRSSIPISELEDHNLSYILFSVKEEPTVDIVRNGVELCRREQCDLVITFGGGSVIDAGKAIAVLSANDGNIFDYLEVNGKGMEISAMAPLILLGSPKAL